MNHSSSSTPSLGVTFMVFLKIGLLSFGGPAAQIALMHRMLVDELNWLKEKQFLNALSFCMLLPGPEAMQLATYAGWRLHGILGGLIAGLLFIIPGAVVIFALASIYAAFGDVPFVNALFLGVKAAVIVIVLEALLRVSKKALKGAAHWVIAALAFAAIFFLDLPYPMIIVAAALYGFFLSDRTDPESEAKPVISVSPARTGAMIISGLALWLIPVFAVAPLTGIPLLGDVGLFFSKLAVVTFGGAYAVLAYMGQEVVTSLGWISAGEMMDGLGLAETTPGPLILVTQFVAFLAGTNQTGGLGLGFAAGTVALRATFAPCFVWIFAGAPYIEWISHQPRLAGALSAISAAVVGVILNLSIWFALHVFFGAVTRNEAGVLTLWTPDLATFDWRVAAIALVSGYLALVRHMNIVAVLAIAAALGLLLSQIA